MKSKKLLLFYKTFSCVCFIKVKSKISPPPLDSTNCKITELDLLKSKKRKFSHRMMITFNQLFVSSLDLSQSYGRNNKNRKELYYWLIY